MCYLDRPDPIAFMPLVVNTSGRLYDDFIPLLFFHVHREASSLSNELAGGIGSVFPGKCRRNRIIFDSFVVLS